tara:strand:- start:986 stop:1570 length:585 start_codon:yes stop_codon:yes gene_type:complete
MPCAYFFVVISTLGEMIQGSAEGASASTAILFCVYAVYTRSVNNIVSESNIYNYLLDNINRSKVSIVMGSQVKGKDGLTNRQRLLVDTLVAEGCSIAKASQIAGYSKGDSGRVTASKTLRLPKVQEYYRSRIAEIGLMGAIPAVKTIVRLAQDAKSDYVKLEASKDILDRSGFKAPDKVQHSVAGNLSIKIDLD